MATKYRKFGDSAQLRQLARDVIRWECRPCWTMQPPPLGYFLKLKELNANGLPLYRLAVLRSIEILSAFKYQIRGESIWSKVSASCF